MMEEVSDDTNGDSTFEFLGETPTSTAMVTPSVPALTSTVPIVPSAPVNLITLPPPPPISNPITPPPIPFPTSRLAADSPMPIDIPPPQPMPTFTPIPQDLITPLPKPIAYQGFQQTSTTSSLLSSPICSAPQPFVNPPAPSSATVDLSMADPYQSMPEFQSKGDPSGVWGWFRGSDILNKVAEKAKNSMESMITTLDPGMKEYIYSGGNVDVVVASDDEDRQVSPVREAFQTAFGRATVSGIPSRPQSVAVQPVGFPAALQGAEEKISLLRHGGQVHQQQAVLAVQNFLVELTPDRWFEMSCLLLNDPTNSASLQTYTQPLAVPLECVLQAQEQTPSDYPLRWSGMAVPVSRGCTGGISQRELLWMAARALGDMYKLRLQQQYI